MRKRLTLGQGAPLVLMPQTYGPFNEPRSRAVAEDIVRRAAACWARDERSFKVLRDLLGDAYDPEKHRQGVDVAFALPTAEPPSAAVAPIAPWLEDRTTPIAGINCSGLLMNTPGVARDQYGFKADYPQVLEDLTRKLLRESDARVLLIPHVVSPAGHYESDIQACETIAKAVEHEAPGRVIVCPPLHDPTHIKWVIAQCDWFCGTRMHSTIAALSSIVPTAAIAYSIKTLGVFESCAQGGHVADPRELDTETVVERLWHSWNERDAARDTLAKALPAVKNAANAQMDAIAGMILHRHQGAPAR